MKTIYSTILCGLVWGALGLGWPGLCQAQNSGASVQVQVTDPSGRAVPGAAVTIAGPAHPAQSARTDIQGQAIFRGLESGNYAIGVTAKGFAPYQLAAYSVAPGPAQSLSIRLALATVSEQVTVTDTTHVEVDPSSNAGALVLRADELQALSDDPDDLATDLQALAGPAAGPNGGQIYIDGFTGGRLPSKQSIREVRINQNPFAAQFDRPGQGRIEIFTKPGADDFHGQLLFQFSDAALNSRNPFVTQRPPYRRRQWEGEFSGPLNKKTSFFMDFERRDIDENAFINALVLDRNLNPVSFSQAVVTPLTGVELNFRIDRQLTVNHTLAARYRHNGDANDNQGVGGFTLASRAYQVRNHEDIWQLTETGALNTRTVNETRFRYWRQRTNENGSGSAAAVNVQDSFVAGGPPLSLSFNHQDRFELQNFTSTVRGKHTVRWGGVMRGISLSDQATQNYQGTFTFNSLDAYRITLLGMASGLTPAQIRAAGGGASQFSIAGGNPLASVHQVDLGFFLQDDWKLRPNFTLSGGLRYEAQSHTRDRSDFGPRVGFAWALGKSAGAKVPKNVIRGGFGLFYDRLSEGLTLDAVRLDGVRQQQFLIPLPDFYPNVPTVQGLTASVQPQAIRQTEAHWQAPRMLQAGLGFERQLPKGITISTNYLHSRGAHALRSRNINAPLSAGGARPYGGVNSIYLYETSGLYRQNQLITNVNAKASPKVTLSGSYVLGYAHSNTDGAGTFPANQYDLSSEYGRAGFDVRHRLQFNGSVALPRGFRLSPFLTVSSGRPYNITVGKDLNGDSLYSDRPALATDLSRASVIRTLLGTFDTAPVAGQRIIPRNFGEAPGMVAANLRFSKTITIFGERAAAGKKPSGDGKQVTFTINARNLINHPNFTAPDGNLSSPLFGRSTGVVGGGTGGNRRLDLQVRLDF